MRHIFDEILSLNEAAARAGLSAVRLRQLADEGRLPAKKIGNSWAVLASDLDHFLGRERSSGRPTEPQTVERRIGIDLRGASPINFENLQYGLASLRLWFRIDNRSDIDVELDRLLVEAWIGQPVATAANLHRRKIPAHEFVQDLMVHSYLLPGAVENVRRRAEEPSTWPGLSLYADSYFNSELGTLHVRQNIERQRGEFVIEL